MNICDSIFSVLPQQVPSLENLSKCKIISHRGQHDNINVFENTLPAFDAVLKTNGVWGIELDFRWTKDLFPVVFHDPDLNRLFDSNLRISEVTLARLKKHFPQIPTLEEVLLRYGGMLHLMVEAKEEYYPQPDKQNLILKKLFSKLVPQRDYHLLSLDPKMLDILAFVDSFAKIPIAIFNAKTLSKISLRNKYAGLGGHYLILQKKIVKKHLDFGQKIGVGYPKSKNNLFREINRGVEWIFCNDAIGVNFILQKELRNAKKLVDLGKIE